MFFSPAYVARTSGLEGIRPHSSNRSAPVGLCRWFHPLRSFPHRSHRCQSSGIPAKRLGRSMVQVFKRKHRTPTFPAPVHVSFHLTIHLAGTQRSEHMFKEEIRHLFPRTWIIIVWEPSRSAKLWSSSPLWVLGTTPALYHPYLMSEASAKEQPKTLTPDSTRYDA